MARSPNQAKGVQAGDQVLLFNSKVKLFGEGKLCSKWKEPYTIINSSPHGAITIQDDDGNIFKVNENKKTGTKTSVGATFTLSPTEVHKIQSMVQN